MNIKVLAPDINKSQVGFHVSGDEIRFGLSAIKNVGEHIIELVIEERDQNGPFLNIQDFCERMAGCNINKRMVESLIKAGAFDGLGNNRHELMAVYERILDAAVSVRRERMEGQIDLFGSSSGLPGIRIPSLPEYELAELLEMEREMIGLYLSGHPMDSHQQAVSRIKAVGIGRINEDFSEAAENPVYSDGDRVVIAGICGKIQYKTTKNNSQMAYITLEDDTGDIELLVFSRTLDYTRNFLASGVALAAVGRLSSKEGEAPKLLCDDLARLSEDFEGFARPQSRYNRPYGADRKNGANGLNGENGAAYESNGGGSEEKTLYLRLDSDSRNQLGRIKAVLQFFPGQSPVILFDAATRRQQRAARGLWVDGSEPLISELRGLIGGENVVYK